MHPVIQDLLQEGLVITDGAWGTELQRRGLPQGMSPELWNIEHPELVEEVPRDYVAAGSRIILTNTFGANRFVQAKQGQEDKVAEMNQAGVAISRRAAADRALVFASMGPSGKLLVMKQVTPDDLRAAFEQQAAALAAADAIVVETMTDLDEALIAIAAAKTTGLPVAACMVFDSGKNKDRTMMGTTPEEAVQAFEQAGADVVGANCGQGIEGFIPVCARMRAATDLPLWMKANAGLPVIENSQTVYKTTPQEFAAHAGRLAEAGATFIGGCCGTNPDFIRALRTTLG